MPDAAATRAAAGSASASLRRWCRRTAAASPSTAPRVAVPPSASGSPSATRGRGRPRVPPGGRPPTREYAEAVVTRKRVLVALFVAVAAFVAIAGPGHVAVIVLA